METNEQEKIKHMKNCKREKEKQQQQQQSIAIVS